MPPTRSTSASATPVGYGWRFDEGYPCEAHGPKFNLRGTIVRDEVSWYPVVLTTGEIRASQSGGREWSGFPLLCRPDNEYTLDGQWKNGQHSRLVCDDLAAEWKVKARVCTRMARCPAITSAHAPHV